MAMLKEHKHHQNIYIGKLWQVTKTHRKVIGGIIVGCTILVALISLILPK